jgi:hypothetical protein
MIITCSWCGADAEELRALAGGLACPDCARLIEAGIRFEAALHKYFPAPGPCEQCVELIGQLRRVLEEVHRG